MATKHKLIPSKIGRTKVRVGKTEKPEPDNIPCRNDGMDWRRNPNTRDYAE